MTLTEAPERPIDLIDEPDVIRFNPPAIPRTPRPATPPDRTRPGAIGAVVIAVRSPSGSASEATEDARIAARRAVVADEADRVRLRPILAILGVLVAAVVVLAVLWSPVLSVHRVTVDGASPADRRTILAAANIQNGTPLVTVDVAAARARVAALPLIDGVRVERVWPRSVLITVATRTPIGVVSVPGSARLAIVDVQGRVIATSFDSEVGGLPVVESVGTGDLVAGDRLGARDRGSVRALAALDVEVRSLVRSVGRDGRTVRLHVAGRGRFADVTVLLGQPDDLRAKSLALRSVLLQDTLSGGAISGIDVSVPDAPILTEK